ncbi:hypothetical protein ACLOJK_040343 [Asimina triloba]
MLGIRIMDPNSPKSPTYAAVKARTVEQPSEAVPSGSPTKISPPTLKKKKVAICKTRMIDGEVPTELLVAEAPTLAQAVRASKKHGASIHFEGEGSGGYQKKKRALKKKTALRDLNYGSMFGGVADYFGWAPATAPMEFLYSSHGKTRHRPMRTYRMEDITERSTPFRLVPEEFFSRRFECQGGYLEAGGCATAHPDDKFSGRFLLPIRAMDEPHDLVVETCRQLKMTNEKYVFECGEHANAFRGCLSDIPGFARWGKHLVSRHSQVLEKAGIKDAILAIGDGFWKSTNVINAFISFWSPTTNSFIFPFGEMSVTLWDLKGVCGLPVHGAPLDECTPPNTVLCQNRLALKVIDVLEKVSKAGGGGDKFTARGWVEIFARISDFEVSNIKWPIDEAKFQAKVKADKCARVASSDGRMWMSLVELQKIEPEVELTLFLWLWLSIVICPSSSKHGLVRWSCLLLACEMAKGKRFALASRVLCDIYRGLNQAVYCEQGPGSACTYYPAHFLFAWLGFYFPFIYGVNDTMQFPDDGLIMRKFANRNFVNRSFAETIAFLLKIGRFDEHFFRMVPSFGSSSKFSSAELTEDEKDFALSLQPGLLALREGPRFNVEPYYPNRFARQFGFDQDIPNEFPFISRAAREVGVGPQFWYATCSRFEDTRFDCEIFFPNFNCKVRATHDYVHWYGIVATKAAECLPPNSSYWAFKPMDLSKYAGAGLYMTFDMRRTRERELRASRPRRVCRVDLDRASKTIVGYRHHNIQWHGVGKIFYDFDKEPVQPNFFVMVATSMRHYPPVEREEYLYSQVHLESIIPPKLITRFCFPNKPVRLSEEVLEEHPRSPKRRARGSGKTIAESSQSMASAPKKMRKQARKAKAASLAVEKLIGEAMSTEEDPVRGGVDERAAASSPEGGLFKDSPTRVGLHDERDPFKGGDTQMAEATGGVEETEAREAKGSKAEVEADEIGVGTVERGGAGGVGTVEHGGAGADDHAKAGAEGPETKGVGAKQGEVVAEVDVVVSQESNDVINFSKFLTVSAQVLGRVVAHRGDFDITDVDRPLDPHPGISGPIYSNASYIRVLQDEASGAATAPTVSSCPSVAQARHEREDTSFDGGGEGEDSKESSEEDSDFEEEGEVGTLAEISGDETTSQVAFEVISRAVDALLWEIVDQVLTEFDQEEASSPAAGAKGEEGNVGAGDAVDATTVEIAQEVGADEEVDADAEVGAEDDVVAHEPLEEQQIVEALGELTAEDPVAQAPAEDLRHEAFSLIRPLRIILGSYHAESSIFALVGQLREETGPNTRASFTAPVTILDVTARFIQPLRHFIAAVSIRELQPLSRANRRSLERAWNHFRTSLVDSFEDLETAEDLVGPLGACMDLSSTSERINVEVVRLGDAVLLLSNLQAYWFELEDASKPRVLEEQLQEARAQLQQLQDCLAAAESKHSSAAQTVREMVEEVTTLKLEQDARQVELRELEAKIAEGDRRLAILEETTQTSTTWLERHLSTMSSLRGELVIAQAHVKELSVSVAPPSDEVLRALTTIRTTLPSLQEEFAESLGRLAP